MRIYRGDLPFNAKGDYPERVAKMDWNGKSYDWFYIEHHNRTFECLYADEGGTFYFAGKELDRVVPVVWNLRREATRVAKKHGGRVKKYPYRLKV